MFSFSRLRTEWIPCPREHGITRYLDKWFVIGREETLLKTMDIVFCACGIFISPGSQNWCWKVTVIFHASVLSPAIRRTSLQVMMTGNKIVIRMQKVKCLKKTCTIYFSSSSLCVWNLLENDAYSLEETNGCEDIPFGIKLPSYNTGRVFTAIHRLPTKEARIVDFNYFIQLQLKYWKVVITKAEL
jgi:hypothetical protein